MLKTEIIKWIVKTFGQDRPGDHFEMTNKITDRFKANLKIRIEELNFVFQRVKNDPHEISEKTIRSWKAELDKITEDSIRNFQVGNEQLFSKASQMDVNEGAAPDQLIIGKSLLLTVNIFHKSTINVAKKIPNEKRH